MVQRELFGMAILTHGGENGQLFTHDDHMNLNEFIEPIKMNSSLVNKPKVTVSNLIFS